MDWTTRVAEWLANQGLALAVAAVAAWVSHRAIKVTRAYQDPLFVMECEPKDIPAAPMGEPDRPVYMYLVNKGNSSARDVRWVANFDPYGIQVRPQEWPLIEKGARVYVQTPFMASSMRMPVLWQLLHSENAAAYATISYKTQSGERREEQVLLPDPRESFTAPEKPQSIL